jgi:hypothetical protein
MAGLKDKIRALQHDCPRCNAKRGEPCVDMRLIRVGRIPSYGNPHGERIVLAQARAEKLPQVYS